MGMDWTKLAAMLHSPSASISWLASTGLPLAARIYETLTAEERDYLFTESLRNGNTLEYSDEGDDYDGGPELGDHAPEVGGDGGAVVGGGGGEGRGCECGQAGLDLPGQGEHAPLGQLRAGGGRRVQQHGQHQAHDHDDGVPGEHNSVARSTHCQLLDIYLLTSSHLAVQMNQTVLATILNAIGGSLLQVAWQPVAEPPDAGLNQFVLFRL